MNKFTAFIMWLNLFAAAQSALNGEIGGALLSLGCAGLMYSMLPDDKPTDKKKDG